MSSFYAQLTKSWQTTHSSLCVGLDPAPGRYPTPLIDDPDQVFVFCREIVDATASAACAFKPQIAYFAAQRAEDALERLCRYIRERYPDHTLVLDAKRGDIGSTAEQYAAEAFDRYGAHAVTVNPYMGTDSVEPFLLRGGIIAICRTSNPGGDDIQNLIVDSLPVYIHIAKLVAQRWAQLGECGLVVGATYPDELSEVRQIATDLPFLIPGVGAQGGDAATAARNAQTADGRGVLISSSRAIIYASSGDDFAEAAATAATNTSAAARTAP